MTINEPSTQMKLAGLSDDRIELLKLLREDRSRRVRTIRAYPRADNEMERVVVPTSLAQQRFWFINQLEEGRGGYQVPIGLRLRGHLDENALRMALDDLVLRHEVLRTVFVAVDGEPKQEIARSARFSLQAIDLTDHDEGTCEEDVRRHKLEEVHTKIDLRNGPVVRGRLLRLKSDEHVLLITMHHIVCDGWSKAVLLQDLAELYAAQRAGRTSSLRPLAIQYADYAQWQREQWLEGELLDRHLNYWRSNLEGAAPQIELPLDRSRPDLPSYRGGKAFLVIDAELSSSLRALAQRYDVTLFMVLYAGLAILLSRLSGQSDIVIGTPIANRQRQELEGLIGLFVNTLVLRVAVDCDRGVSELLEQVKGVTLGAYDHQGVPFEKVVEALHPHRSLNRNPLFQVMFVLHNEPRSDFQVPGLVATAEQEVEEPSITDLWLSLHERGDEIAGSMIFASDLFNHDTVERWLDSYVLLLKGMARQPQRRIGDLHLLADSEWQTVVNEFNATEESYPRSRTLHQLFEEQVVRTPGAIAVVHEGRSLTYADLNRRANQLARHLLDTGAVGPERIVAICMPRTLELLVGVMAILKAGGAYLPLDPSYPTERLEYMLGDSGASVLLIHPSVQHRLPTVSIPLIMLEGAEFTGLPSENLELGNSGASSGNAAYVIYTSGSTGMPKGVVIEHRNAVNLIRWATTVGEACEFKRTLQSTSLNFDLSVYECFAALAVGGAVCIVENALSLLESPVDVTLINTVPSAMAGILNAGCIPASTSVVNLAGEALERGIVERIFSSSAVQRVRNLYGPSETTTYSTALSMSRDTGFIGTIGKPIANTRIYILGSRREVVGLGVTGEIFISGLGVARGYVNRPELTADRFVPDPFSHSSSSRLYRTGDLGRWRPDGSIEYLGRNDQQVKIRGYRIELGEIEAQLAAHPDVAAAAVMVRSDDRGERRLVGYIHPVKQKSLNLEDLRQDLRHTLPEYMVPYAIVVMHEWPLTSTGKVNRHGLPAPDFPACREQDREAPRGEIESAIAEIWHELLRAKDIGRFADFFELGGHSVLATRVIARIKHVFQIEMPLRVIFENPTIEALSSWILRALTSDRSAEAQ